MKEGKKLLYLKFNKINRELNIIFHSTCSTEGHSGVWLWFCLYLFNISIHEYEIKWHETTTNSQHDIKLQFIQRIYIAFFLSTFFFLFFLRWWRKIYIFSNVRLILMCLYIYCCRWRCRRAKKIITNKTRIQNLKIILL